MKHCNWNYPIWWIREDFPEKDWAKIIPHPFCHGCDYIKACTFRVEYWLSYDEDMPEEELENMKEYTSPSRETKKPDILN